MNSTPEPSTERWVKYHRLIGKIIHHHSTNCDNVYSHALQDIQFARPINVLDLGCGYGLFTQALKNNIPEESFCLGIDKVRLNQDHYLDVVRQAGFRGDFLCKSADIIKEFPDRQYDLILCGYSLYYFVCLLPHIARLLTPDGSLIALTHSNRALREFFRDVGSIYASITHQNFSPEELETQCLLEGFCAENGYSVLQPYFNQVKRVIIENDLVFYEQYLRNCFIYLDYKRQILLHGKPSARYLRDTDITKEITTLIRHKTRQSGAYRLNKNDAVFHAQHPVTEWSS